jgi:hypothetical protein
MHKIDFSDGERIYVTHMHLTRPYAVVAGCTTYLEWAVSLLVRTRKLPSKLLALKKKKTSRPPKGFCKPGELLFPWIWPFSNLIFLQFYFILFYFHRWSNIEDDDDLGLVINDESKLNFMLRLFFIWMSILNLEKELKPCKQGTKTT